MGDYIVELLLIAILLVIVVGGVWALTLGHTDGVAQCMRAFEYTRDQCEFIIKYRVMPK